MYRQYGSQPPNIKKGDSVMQKQSRRQKSSESLDKPPTNEPINPMSSLRIIDRGQKIIIYLDLEKHFAFSTERIFLAVLVFTQQQTTAALFRVRTFIANIQD